MDASGNVYGEGDTESRDYPTTTGAYQTVNRSTVSMGNLANQEAMAYQMAADGSHFIWSTYLGGSGISSLGDNAEGGLVLDSSNNVYIAANTPGSANFFSTNGGQATGFQKTLPAGNGQSACTISHISADGSTMLHSTFLGGTVVGSAGTQCANITLDASGNVVVYGNTGYIDFPTTAGVYQATETDTTLEYGMVVVLSPDLSTLIAGTFIGSTCGPPCASLDNAGGIGIDANGNIYASMATASNTWPMTSDAYNSTYVGEGNDMVIFGLSHDLKTLVYGTYLGGTTPNGYTQVSAGNWPWQIWVTH